MNIRRQVLEVLQGVFGFGKITRSTGHGVYDTDGEISEAETPECERWGDAAVLSRPQVGAEVKYIQLGDERVILATREPRWQVDVAPGEVVVRAMGAESPAYIRLKPDGRCEVVATRIDLGAANLAGSLLVAIGALVDARIANIVTWANTHTHPVATTGSAAAQSGTASATASPLATQDSVSASKTRAQ